jgi:cytochrome P450
MTGKIAIEPMRAPSPSAPRFDFNHLISRPRDAQYAMGAELANELPIFYSEAHGGVFYVSSYELIKQILLDTEHFSNLDGVSEPGHKFDFNVVPSQADPPDHGRYRNALQEFLRPTAIKKHEDVIRPIIINAMADIIANKGGDVVTEFAIHVPLRVAAAVLGYSEKETHRLHDAFATMLEGSLELNPSKQELGRDAFLKILFDAYDRSLGNLDSSSMLSLVVHYNKDGDRFTREEALGLMAALTIGSIDTTKHSITNTVFLFAKFPAVYQELLENRSLVSAAVEESLRLESVSYFNARTVIKDVTIGGVDLRAGNRVIMSYAWANRDEKFFDDPTRFDLHRKRNHHFGFGHGVHSCLGMHLARMEMRIAIEEMLDRIPRFELVEPAPDPQNFGSVIYGFKHLNIRILD